MLIVKNAQKIHPKIVKYVRISKKYIDKTGLQEDNIITLIKRFIKDETKQYK